MNLFQLTNIGISDLPFFSCHFILQRNEFDCEIRTMVICNSSLIKSKNVFYVRQRITMSADNLDQS